MKLTEAVAIFLSQQRPSTQRSYKYVLRDMIKFTGDKEITQVTRHHIAEYSDELNSRNYKSNHTWNKYVKTLRTFFNFSVKQGLIDRSPASIMKMRREPTGIPKDKAMPDDDLKQLLTYTQFDARYYALILFLADTGCRARGASQLRVKDIDFGQNEALVTEKGEKTRKVHFGEMCAQALRTWLTQRSSAPDDFVFSLDGGPMLSSSISQIVRRCCQRAGIKPRGSHSLRHRKGHQLADAKVAPSVAKTVLGHSSVEITMNHYYPEDWDRARKAMDELAVADDTHTTIVMFPRRKTK